MMEPKIHLPNGDYLTFIREHDHWKIALSSGSSVKLRKNDVVYLALKIGFSKETFKKFPKLLDDLIINKELVRITSSKDTVYLGKACTLITTKDLNENFKQTFSRIVDDINKYFGELEDVLQVSNKKIIIHISEFTYHHFGLCVSVKDQTFISKSLIAETLVDFLKVLINHPKVSHFETSRDRFLTSENLIKVSSTRPIIQIRSAMKSVLSHIITDYVEPDTDESNLPYSFAITKSYVQVLTNYFIEHLISIDDFENLRFLPLLYKFKLSELKYIKKLSDLAVLSI